MKKWALYPYAFHQAIEYKIENGHCDYARSQLGYIGNKQSEGKKGALTRCVIYLWQSLPKCSAGDKANPEKLGQWQCFNIQVTLGRKNKTSTSTAFGRNKWTPSMLNMAKPEGVSNSSKTNPLFPNLSTATNAEVNQTWVSMITKEKLLQQSAIQISNVKSVPSASAEDHGTSLSWSRGKGVRLCSRVPFVVLGTPMVWLGLRGGWRRRGEGRLTNSGNLRLRKGWGRRRTPLSLPAFSRHRWPQ